MNDEYLKILTGNELKDFIIKNVGEYCKSKEKNLDSKLCKYQNINNVESLNHFIYF